MTLLASLAGLCAVLISGFLFTGLGWLFVGRVSVRVPSRTERLLFSLGIGVIVLELLVTLGELMPNVRVGVTSAIVIAAALGLLGVSRAALDIAQLSGELTQLHGLARWLALGVGGVLFIEGFAAMAPLTGSDALHYHFAASAAVLRDGFHANWFLSHSFFTGLSHQLVLAGLAEGSQRLALGWIFLGGALAALTAAHLTQQWFQGVWPWLTALAFLLTPVAFWQITTAGAPDIWMAFFATVGVLAIVRAKESSSFAAAVVAGIFAGGAAGTKYTGLILAAALLAAFAWEVRSVTRSAVYFVSAVVTGVWPYLRNWIWTGDPVFPFLMRHLDPARTNLYTLGSYLADTGASAPRGLLQLVRFPAFAAVDQGHLGFWQFLGPLVLALAPLTVLAVRNTPMWRAVLIVWIAGAIGIGFSSGMTRFLLPLLPIALAASVAGVAYLNFAKWRIVRTVAIASIVCFLLFGFGGLLVYDRAALAASAGIVSREQYLSRRAPDYGFAEFVNRELSGKEAEGRALVFFRHVYYLQIPYVYGDPAASWAMDPTKLQTDRDWREFFRMRQIRWVVRTDAFPPALNDALERLTSEQALVPCAAGQVVDWSGNRIGGVRKLHTITIFCVRN